MMSSRWQHFVSRDTETTHGIGITKREAASGKLPHPNRVRRMRRRRSPDPTPTVLLLATSVLPKTKRPLAWDRPSPRSRASGQNIAFAFWCVRLASLNEQCLPSCPCGRTDGGCRRNHGELAHLCRRRSRHARPKKSRPSSKRKGEGLCVTKKARAPGDGTARAKRTQLCPLLLARGKGLKESGVF
jgi:hypothetical protein